MAFQNSIYPQPDTQSNGAFSIPRNRSNQDIALFDPHVTCPVTRDRSAPIYPRWPMSGPGRGWGMDSVRAAGAATGSGPDAATGARLGGLDGIRGLAALFVVLHHCWLLSF